MSDMRVPLLYKGFTEGSSALSICTKFAYLQKNGLAERGRSYTRVKKFLVTERADATLNNTIGSLRIVAL